MGAYFADKPDSYGDNGGSLKVKIVERSNITLTTDDGYGNPDSAPTMLEKGPRGAYYLLHREGGNRNLPLKVFFTITGTATYYTDYRVLAGSNFKHEHGNLFSITFPKQSFSGVVDQTESFFVYAVEDYLFENDELIKVKIEPLNGSSYTPEEKYTSPSNTATVTILNQSHKPDFQPPDINNTYQVKISSSTKKGLLPNSTTNFVTTRATDPDSGDTLTYRMVSGNTNYFSVNATNGRVSLKVDAKDLPWHYYSLKIRATDRAGLYSVAQVNTTVIPEVGIYGDTIAVEDTSDAIQLKIARISKPTMPKPALKVNYKIIWQHINNSNNPADTSFFDYEKLKIDEDASPDDFQASQLAALLNGNNTDEGFVIIPAGADSVELPKLIALNDDSNETIERFRIEIIPDPAYKPTPAYKSSPTVEDGLRVEPLQELAVFDKVQLFSSKRGLTLNDKRNPALGIDPNDIDQGRAGNCWVHAAMLRMTLENPGFIRNNLFIDEPNNHRFGVKLNLPAVGGVATRDPGLEQIDGTVAKTIWIPYSKVFTRGLNAATVSGDYDDNGIEIWTVLLEQAISNSITDGWSDGCLSRYAWIMMTGKDLEYVVRPTSAQLTSINEGDAVILSSLRKGSLKLESGEFIDIVNPHAYVLSKENGKFYLYEPRIEDKRTNLTTNDITKLIDLGYFWRAFFQEIPL